jgi:hypothetical protein
MWFQSLLWLSFSSGWELNNLEGSKENILKGEGELFGGKGITGREDFRVGG